MEPNTFKKVFTLFLFLIIKKLGFGATINIDFNITPENIELCFILKGNTSSIRNIFNLYFENKLDSINSNFKLFF